MTTKQFAKIAIEEYLENGGKVTTDITLNIFQFIEKDEELLSFYKVLVKGKKPMYTNAQIGKTIREHFGLRAGDTASAACLCNLIATYTKLY